MPNGRRDPGRRPPPLLHLGIVAFAIFCLAIAKAIFIPIALAMLLTFVLAPVTEWLRRWRLPRVAAVIVTVVLAFSALGGLAWLLASQVTTLAGDVPKYEHNLRGKVRELRRMGRAGPLEKAQSTVKEVVEELAKDDAPGKRRAPQPVVVESAPPTGLAAIAATLGPLADVLAGAGLVVVLVIFMLIERERLLERVIRLAGTRRLTLTTKVLTEAAERIGRYLRMQGLINAGFGAAIAAGLALVGVPYALLLGAVAGALRFIPYVGAWVGAGLAAVVSLAVFDGWREPLLALALFVVVELLVYLVIEPLLYSHSAGISPLALLITLAFWTWLWGPIGLILGTPLTVCLVALGRHVPDMAYIVVLFGDEPVVAPDVALYQRLLKGDDLGARSLLEDYVKTHAAADAWEQVLGPALGRARQDAARGAVTPEELVAIAALTRRVLDALDAEVLAPAAARDAAVTAPPAVRLVAVACPARDELDAAGLRMLPGRLAAAGVRLEVLDAGLLAAEVLDRVAALEPGAALVGVLTPGGGGHARYLVKRLRGRFPDLPVVAACWGPHDDADEACAGLLDAGASDVVTTLREAGDRVGQYRLVRGGETPSRAA